MKYKVGSMVLLKQGCKLVKAIVIDVDLTFVTLKLHYKKGEGATVKMNINSKDIIKFDGGVNIKGFDYTDNITRL